MELLGDGETTTNMSAYDTALVALVKNLEGGDGPQFPSCIDWIVQNQLPDGSWGDPAFFMVQDRMISTLACVVALKSWKIDNANLCDRGVSFIQENMSRLVEDEQDWMPSGFEINFPALLDRAKDLNLDIPYNHPVLEEIYTKRNLKLSKIPLELLHATPTTLLFSLEGMADLQLDWEKLLKLRCPDGSFHSSPASTAAALSQTGDKECLAFLERLVNKFDGGAVFKHFEKDGKFVCFPMETNHSSVTPMHNTYRASHFMFPGDDDVLARAGNYCQSFLQERQASNKLYDKWIIAKDLPGEVEYTLNFPWQASLPRIETRMYLDQYGGSTDVWIGKVLYRMKLVSNDLYLKMAKADFKEYQRLSRLEWNGLRKGPKGSTENLEDLIDLVSFDDASGALHEAVKFIEQLHLYMNVHIYNADFFFTRYETEYFLWNLQWKQWLMAWTAKESRGSIEGDTALLLVRTVEICSGRHVTAEQNLNLWDYSQLEQLTSSICRKLATIVLAQNGVNMENTEDLHRQVNLEMQELSWHVHQGCHGINIETRRTFLNVVKSFYYSAHCSHETVDSHIAKVIFQDVI
ncbi:Syn-copalyl diphosphate synthase [Triticum urartu]|uniref:Syn-copalyl diphosphate synthase n=1 Tax=Triticum urartu TaxID=4572 RepID=M7ZXX6_TRIUA|nr:Syn-copalyl diphosphate synthase [Triticum urartu]